MYKNTKTLTYLTSEIHKAEKKSFENNKSSSTPHQWS